MRCPCPECLPDAPAWLAPWHRLHAVEDRRQHVLIELRQLDAERSRLLHLLTAPPPDDWDMPPLLPPRPHTLPPL